MDNQRKFHIIVIILSMLFVLTASVLIGHATHTHAEQKSKYQIECIKAGGNSTYESKSGSVICMK